MNERIVDLSKIEDIENSVLRRARSVLDVETDGINALKEALGAEFVSAVKEVLTCRGRIIISGLGKSGHIAHKIAATLASTGSPALFVHASEAAHGDLGMISGQDVAILISNSGETTDLVPIIQHLSRLKIPLIGITSGAESTLARHASIPLILPAAQEACPQGIAPTTSTTMTLALGDALAMAAMDLRGFSREDFRLLHPGGAIGLRLMKVSEIMHKGEKMPLVSENTAMNEVIMTMTSKSFGTAGVVNDAGALVGVITDGDLRRNIENLSDKTAVEVMTADPTIITASTLAEDALRVLHGTKVTALFVLDDDHASTGRAPLGLVHVHDFLRLGLS